MTPDSLKSDISRYKKIKHTSLGVTHLHCTEMDLEKLTSSQGSEVSPFKISCAEGCRKKTVQRGFRLAIYTTFEE